MANQTYNTKDVIAVGYKNIEDYGYNKTSDYSRPIEQSTKYRVISLLDNPDSPRASDDEIAKFMDWVNETNPDSDYVYKAKAACNKETCEKKDLSFILSFIGVYFKALERKAQDEKRAHERDRSDYAGAVGDKVSFIVKEYRVLYWKEPYAYNSPAAGVYRLIDEDGHIYIWSTSADGIDNGVMIVATVKGYKEYRGEKQTVITRGKILYPDNYHTEDDRVGPAADQLYDGGDSPFYDRIGY